jgi:hypothetical protein
MRLVRTYVALERISAHTDNTKRLIVRSRNVKPAHVWVVGSIWAFRKIFRPHQDRQASGVCAISRGAYKGRAALASRQTIGYWGSRLKTWVTLSCLREVTNYFKPKCCEISPVWWPGVKNSSNVTHACRKRRLKWAPSAWGYSWATRAPDGI